MKQIGLLTFILAFSVFQVDAQTKSTKVDMEFSKIINGAVAHDFGSIVYGANGKVDFTYTNKGTKPLIIKDVQSSCGCTVPTWTKEPVEPGKTGTITIVYNTTLPGAFSKTVVVTSNANNSPVRIEIRGKVNSQPSDIQPKLLEQAPAVGEGEPTSGQPVRKKMVNAGTELQQGAENKTEAIQEAEPVKTTGTIKKK